MVFILKEKAAKRIVSRYRKVAVFSLAKDTTAVTIGGEEIPYRATKILPSEDTINAVISGDVKLRKVIKKAIKWARNPNMKDPDRFTFGLELSTMITMINNNREGYGKQYRGTPTAVVFLLDAEDKKRNKVLTKYLTELLAVYGIKPITKGKTVKKLFGKKLSRTINNCVKVVKDPKSHQTINLSGLKVHRNNTTFFCMELQQQGMNGLTVDDMGKRLSRTWTKTLLATYTGENLQKVSTTKIAKNLAKKNQLEVKAYKQLRELLIFMDPKLKLPKVKYGQKKKGKGKNRHCIGPKMNTKKFTKFFKKEKNRAILLMIYAHTLAIILGYKPGDSEYNKHMKDVCDRIRSGFGKEFVSSVNAYVKATKADGDTAVAKR